MPDQQKSGTVVHFVADIGGGVWSVVKTLAEHHRRRWRCLLVAVHKGQLSTERTAEVRSLLDGAHLAPRPNFFGSYHLMPLSVSAALSKLGVDPNDESNVYQFHTGPFTPLVYRLPPRPRRGKWLACFHGARGNFGDTRSALKQSLHRRSVRQMLRDGFTLVAVSQRSAEDCAEMYGCDAEDFKIVYNGAGDVSRETSPRAQPHTPFHVGFVGTVMPIKGWRKVIDAVQQLRGRGRNVICSIVGSGPESGDLHDLASRHADWLQAPGHVSDPQQHVFPNLDALVLPSEFEGHPRVLLEALAAGVPCVCSDVGGNAETIRDGQEGFVLRETTSNEIAEKLERLIGTSGIWPRMADNCRRRHGEMFTASHMSDSWERLYREGASFPTNTPVRMA